MSSHRRELLAPFALAFAAGWLVSNVGAVAGPMADAYGVSLAFVGAFAAAAVATHALMQLPSGRLVDRYGARAAAIAGLSILVAADGIGAIAPEPALAVPTRLAVGVGTALTFVAGSDLLRAQPRARVRAGALRRHRDVRRRTRARAAPAGRSRRELARRAGSAPPFSLPLALVVVAVLAAPNGAGQRLPGAGSRLRRPRPAPLPRSSSSTPPRTARAWSSGTGS